MLRLVSQVNFFLAVIILVSLIAAGQTLNKEKLWWTLLKFCVMVLVCLFKRLLLEPDHCYSCISITFVRFTCAAFSELKMDEWLICLGFA